MANIDADKSYSSLNHVPEANCDGNDERKLKAGASVRFAEPYDSRRNTEDFDYLNNVLRPKGHDNFPACIVWTPIPIITWFFPLIGHIGISHTNGVIRDFIGSYTVGLGSLGFGRPLRFIKLNLTQLDVDKNLNKAIETQTTVFEQKRHDLVINNCHLYVTNILNDIDYQHTKWNQVKLASQMFFFGNYVDTTSFLLHWLPTLFVWAIIVSLFIFI